LDKVLKVALDYVFPGAVKFSRGLAHGWHYEFKVNARLSTWVESGISIIEQRPDISSGPKASRFDLLDGVV